jgi:hypothetical protein
MGGSCTTVTPPGETMAIVDAAGQTLSCDGSAYQAVTTAVVTNLVTATVTASGQASAHTIVSTYMPADASANAVIASATASINAAMAQATLAADKYLWRGALSVANPKPGKYSMREFGTQEAYTITFQASSSLSVVVLPRCVRQFGVSTRTGFLDVFSRQATTRLL